MSIGGAAAVWHAYLAALTLKATREVSGRVFTPAFSDIDPLDASPVSYRLRHASLSICNIVNNDVASPELCTSVAMISIHSANC